MHQMEIFELLLERIGPRQWWPADSPFEVMVGAILTQNTAWTNVEKAIARMKSEGLLEPEALQNVALGHLARIIRPSGYYNQKAKKLKALVDYFVYRYGASIEEMKKQDQAVLRRELLAVNGIGPETADAILLYALEKPAFVVDTYTRRMLSRHKWLEAETASYDDVQAFFVKQLPARAALFNEFHALIDFVGHHFCRSEPQCQGCPLQDRLPN